MFVVTMSSLLVFMQIIQLLMPINYGVTSLRQYFCMFGSPVWHSKLVCGLRSISLIYSAEAYLWHRQPHTSIVSRHYACVWLYYASVRFTVASDDQCCNLSGFFSVLIIQHNENNIDAECSIQCYTLHHILNNYTNVAKQVNHAGNKTVHFKNMNMCLNS
jgi:hypothetical protein